MQASSDNAVEIPPSDDSVPPQSDDHPSGYDAHQDRVMIRRVTDARDDADPDFELHRAELGKISDTSPLPRRKRRVYAKTAGKTADKTSWENCVTKYEKETKIFIDQSCVVTLAASQSTAEYCRLTNTAIEKLIDRYVKD